VRDLFKENQIFSDVVPLQTTRWQQRTSISLYFNFIKFNLIITSCGIINHFSVRAVFILQTVF